MRPPSYYASIVKSNSSTTGHSYSSPDYDSAPRTSSQQLRSSLSSPSSSSYVSRSHLPFVPQSTLVAHCFTGVGSSTRPYGSTNGSLSSYRSGGGGASGLYISSSPSRSSASSYSANSSVSSLSSRQPSTKRAYSSSSSSYSSTTTTSSSSLLRPSYLSPNALPPSSLTTATSLTSRYRPTKTSALSSYYKPIRLRERPLLTQISRQIASPTPPPASLETTRASEPRTIHSNASETSEASSESKIDNEHSGRETRPDDWSSDIGRNISRNKYLIKFREIDKHSPGARTSLDIEATIELPADCSLHKEPPKETATYQTAELSLPVPDVKANRKEPDMKLECGEVENTRDKIPPRDMQITAGASEEQQTVRKVLPKREKKNVKLRLRPVAGGGNLISTKTIDAEATTTTTIIKKSEDKEATAASLLAANTDSQQQKADKPIKVKRVIKSKEEKENRTEKEAESLLGHNGKETATASAGVKPSGQDATPAKTKKKKRTNKEAEDETQPAEPSKPSSGSAGRSAPSATRTTTKVTREQPETAAHQTGSSQLQMNEAASPKKVQSRIRFRQYNYDDFNFLTVLGHGGWGFVILAELKEHDACFAVKCIKKITIVEDDDYDSIMIERKVLALGNIHPFICKLFCTFETEGYLFFVMEYCAGGDLMFHVQHEGKFTESRCRFYASEIICAIRFLHNRHIIYRDLKLDNILLDARGHIRLVDFGMCQCRTYREEMLPSNFCGTPEYISPEIIKGVPYNHSVDWWSFGVLLYEMAVGKMPFRGNDENELLWNVCYEQIHYPMFLSKELTSLLKLLLEREPSMRMGMASCKAGDIYDQPYFRGVDWKAVEEMRVEPPFVPEVKSNRDVSNFDSDFTESTCELSPVDESTLAKIDQKQFQQFPYTNPDIFIFDTNHTA